MNMLLWTQLNPWWNKGYQFSSVAQSCLTLRPQGLQHTRLLSPSPSSGACSKSCPLSWRCHPNISSSAIPFSSCFQSFPASGSFPISQFFTSNGQSIGASASASVPLVNILGWFPLGLTGLISLQPKGLSRIFSNNTVQKGYKHLWQRVLTPKRKQSAMESIWTLT